MSNNIIKIAEKVDHVVVTSGYITTGDLATFRVEATGEEFTQFQPYRSRVRDRSKYTPHQGQKECTRRIKA